MHSSKASLLFISQCSIGSLLISHGLNDLFALSTPTPEGERRRFEDAMYVFQQCITCAVSETLSPGSYTVQLYYFSPVLLLSFNMMLSLLRAASVLCPRRPWGLRFCRYFVCW